MSHSTLSEFVGEWGERRQTGSNFDKLRRRDVRGCGIWRGREVGTAL